MAKCPECGDRIGYGALCTHSAFTPITCPKCGATLHYDSRSWFRIGTPVMLPIAALIVTTLCGLRSLWVQVPLLALLCIFLVKFMFAVRTLKLVVKRKKHAQPAPPTLRG